MKDFLLYKDRTDKNTMGCVWVWFYSFYSLAGIDYFGGWITSKGLGGIMNIVYICPNIDEQNDKFYVDYVIDKGKGLEVRQQVFSTLQRSIEYFDLLAEFKTKWTFHIK